MAQRKIGKALVVGAGISGIRSALDLAEAGYGVTLIDRAAHLGGILSQLDYQFPTDGCGMCKMLPLVDRDASSQYCLRKGLFHENIEILLSTEVVDVEGEPGSFSVSLRRKPSWVDAQRCIGCGACSEVCPVEVPDAFNAGLSARKAIYLPVPHAVPNSYVIDLAACTLCGECEKACPTGAIVLSDQKRRDFRILVVDDELIIRDSLKEWLEGEEGFTVEVAESGREALERLGQQRFHLMLLDIKMPGMDGVEVLEAAKADHPQVQVLMMTAYATVETAVEAMKLGALDYIMKPFDPETLVPKVVNLYEEVEAARGQKLEVGAIVLSGGTVYFDPADGPNTFGYGVYPNVVTSIEFERILSGTGPCGGALKRPGDGKPLQRVAWIQCVGSRDLQSDADFCSSVCCMFTIKEALLAREKAAGELDASIFYMDMRTFGKSFQRYRDRAEAAGGIHFIRGRVHSVVPHPESTDGDLSIRYTDPAGQASEERFELVVLAVGQRPAPGMERMAEMLGLGLNPWGFVDTEPFSLNRTANAGVYVGGSSTGLKDISESVIQSSAAAVNASRVIHAAGGGLVPEPQQVPPYRDVSRELPRVLVVVCTCGRTLADDAAARATEEHFRHDADVAAVEFVEQSCTAQGWERVTELARSHRPNRLLIGACLPYVYARKLRELGAAIGLDPALMEVVDIYSIGRRIAAAAVPEEDANRRRQMAELDMGLARLKRVEPTAAPSVAVVQRALVVGGGIGGMTAALAIADHGYAVDVVEQAEALGGNLRWLKRTLEGHSTQPLLEETLQKVEKHPQIHVHTGSRVVASYGQVGHFYTTVTDADENTVNIEHGAVILATGGSQAATQAYGYGTTDAVVTQKELEEGLEAGTVDPNAMEAVVMIQCVECREEPRNYCSRVCCASALKHALRLREQNPRLAVYILYRDMMTYGFAETYFTKARQAGVVFIQYEPGAKPRVAAGGDAAAGSKPLTVELFEPILGRRVQIEADLAVLATGVVPNLPPDLAAAFGAELDADGFFREAESKWRPVEALKEGIFACGLAHSPRSLPETIATADAAGQRALRLLDRARLPAGRVVAKVHHSICSLCERCIEACPYGARALDVDEEKVTVNPVMCQGCGSCAAVCPNSASYLEGFTEPQMFDVIDAALS